MDWVQAIGRGLVSFLIAVALDVVGLVLFLVGVSAPLSYWDFLVFSGSLVIFLSLVFWIIWYVSNLTVPYKELLPN